MNIELSIINVTAANKRLKLIKAACALSERLGLGASIDYPVLEKSHKYLDREWRNGGWVYTYPDTGGGGGSESTREPWDSSSDKVKELKAEDWGTPEEIAEMAQMPRTAKNRFEAEQAIENIISHNGEQKSASIILKSKSGLSAYLRRSSIGKIVSGVQKKEMPVEALYLAAANIDKLFSSAIEPWKFEMNPNKDNRFLKDRRILYAPMEYGERIVPVKITVKEYQDQTAGNKIYSVEAINFEVQPIKKGAIGTLTAGRSASVLHRPSKSLLYNTIPHLFDSVNEYLRKSRITYPDIEVLIRNITLKNRKAKFTKAIRAVSKALNVPVEIGHTHRESYLFPVQQELADKWAGFYQPILRNIYTVVTTALGLPKVEVETLRKALDAGLLRYGGKVLYSPETGEPLKKKDFDALIQAIEKFLNRKSKETGKRIVLDAVTVEKLLKRMAKYQTTQELESLTLDKMKYRGKPFDWIREDIKNIRDAFRIDGYEMSRAEMARYQVAQDYVAQLVTRVNNNIKDEIKDVVLNGIVERRSKSQVSQDLFNRLGSLNRDWKRMADTELANTENLANILEEVQRQPAGEKVYFKRYELPGCCDACARVDGKVVLWSDTPLTSDKIKDEYADTAIWEGKPQEKGKTTLVTGTLHPNCRGGWLPWGGEEVDAMIAKVGHTTEKWDTAVNQARDEFKERGIENPNDQTKGYKERINEIYRSLPR